MICLHRLTLHDIAETIHDCRLCVAGSVEEIPHVPSSPPMSPLRTTTRTLGQTTERALTAEPQTMIHTSTHMADVASETILLNKIKKKLDSVLVRTLTHLNLPKFH